MDKSCSKCKAVLPVASFNKNRSKADGLSTECKGCVKAACAAHYAANRDARLEQNRANYAANKDAYKERAREWEQANPERVRELKAAYRERHREKLRDVSANDWLKHGDKRRAKKVEYRAANPERGAEHVRARQTRLTQQMPAWADRAAILKLYKLARQLSDITGIPHHVDHFYPLRGRLVSGLHVAENLQVLPALDNQRKGNRQP